MRLLLTNVVLIFLTGAAFGQTLSKVISSTATGQSPKSAASDIEGPIKALPYTPSLDTDFVDRSADPCVDFYQFSCGGWMAKNPIPPDQAGWSVYGKLYQENQRFLWGILDSLARILPIALPTSKRSGTILPPAWTNLR